MPFTATKSVRPKNAFTTILFSFDVRKIIFVHSFSVYCILVLFIGLVARSLAAYLAVSWTDLNFKEKIFIVGAWLPKATVQVSLPRML